MCIRDSLIFIIGFPDPPRRIVTISLTILNAISSGVVPAKSNPAGEWTRFNSSGATPSSSRYSKTSLARLVLATSTKRAELVFEYLLDEGVAPEDLKRVHSPAGLDFAGTTPEEIALSIVSEMVTIRRGGSGKPMMKIKKISPV